MLVSSGKIQASTVVLSLQTVLVRQHIAQFDAILYECTQLWAETMCAFTVVIKYMKTYNKKYRKTRPFSTGVQYMYGGEWVHGESTNREHYFSESSGETEQRHFW